MPAFPTSSSQKQSQVDVQHSAALNPLSSDQQEAELRRAVCGAGLAWCAVVVLYAAGASGAAASSYQGDLSFVLLEVTIALGLGVLASAGLPAILCSLIPRSVGFPSLRAFIFAMPWLHGPWLLVGPITLLLTIFAIAIGFGVQSPWILIWLFGLGFPLWLILSLVSVLRGTLQLSAELRRKNLAEGMRTALLGWAWMVCIGSTCVGFGGVALGGIGAISFAARVYGFDFDASFLPAQS